MQTPQIMLVEDERIVAMHLRQQLVKLGYQVPAIVSSGEQALRQLDGFRPDLILMDIHIEGPLDGIATAAAIPPDYHIPIIYLTAYSEEATLARARATRPHGYLIKPFSERELHATIQMTLERCRTETDLRASEERLRQAQKMEAIGQLAGGVAHDFNNLLQVIYANLDEMTDHVGTDAIMGALIDRTFGAARRGATLTEHLLAYSRRQPLSPRVLDVGGLVTKLIDLLRRTLGETIDIQLDIKPDLWKTRIDANQLDTAILNLALNARDAMPTGGRLTIGAENSVLDQDYADTNVEVNVGNYVMLAVTDTGAGMPKDVLDKVFEPFFTTKPIGRGSGLGLSMVYGFVKQSAGHIGIYSEVGHGTTVRMYLPSSNEDIEEPTQRADPTPVPRAKPGEVILVVDDDEDLREATLYILRSLGFETLAADRGVAALDLLDTAPRVDLLLTDVVLPDGMHGGALAVEAMSRRPDLKVLYISGYPSNVIVHNGILDAGAILLSKPFRRIELARKLRELLDADDEDQSEEGLIGTVH